MSHELLAALSNPVPRYCFCLFLLLPLRESSAQKTAAASSSPLSPLPPPPSVVVVIWTRVKHFALIARYAQIPQRKKWRRRRPRSRGGKRKGVKSGEKWRKEERRRTRKEEEEEKEERKFRACLIESRTEGGGDRIRSKTYVYQKQSVFQITF